jgi:hypothetical protein
MPRYYGSMSLVSGWLSGMFAVLALLAAEPARADDLSECQALCSQYTNQDYSMCVGNCMNGATICDLTCSGSYPKCGDGTCDTNKKGCEAYKCKLILLAKQCECNRN